MLAPYRETLVEAFFDDPITAWMFPDEGERRQGMAAMFEATLKAGIPAGKVHSLPGGAAVSIWQPPPSGEENLVRRLCGDRATDILEGFRLLDEARPSEGRYLEVLGVHPDEQGRGRGRELMEPQLRALDAEGIPTHLFSSNPRNLTFYARLGYGIVEEVQMPNGPPLIRMWRDVGTWGADLSQP